MGNTVKADDKTKPAKPPYKMAGAGTALLLLSLLNLLNYYDRLLIVIVSQPLRVEFHLTDTQYGLLTGPAFVVVYASASLFFGVLSDRQSRKGVIALALLLWSLMTALCGLAQSFAALAMSRAGVGVGEGAANPAGMSMLSDYYPPQRRYMALAIFAAGGMIGMLFSFLLGSWITVHYGWRAVFLVAGIPGVVLAIIMLFVVREPERGRFERRAVIRLSYRQIVSTLAANKAYWWLSLSTAFGVFSSLGMLIWLPQFFIRVHGMTVSQVGMIFGPVATLGLLAGTMVGGWLGNYYARRGLAEPVLICITANMIIAPLYAAVLFTGSTALALVCTFLAMALSMIFAPAFQASMQSVLSPDVRGTGGAVLNMLAAVVAQGALPLAVGMLSDALTPTQGADGPRLALTISIAAALIAGFGFLGALSVVRRHFVNTDEVSDVEDRAFTRGG